ncbi:Tripartite tricarboxylate transporter TctB family protein [Tistlia consotensis]|uniref:Tripartite tricarboxylate transporter TctB family protein n=1 Tax=Tistlia consotensis USBA 355 TaxID=560819 RepID=A0A1Y6B828_9PROT|nr:tripartite tricarboxylate transporter TctB family protein [Tistlia consotensis]SME90110.1 Tripartite tricarboxylate transporter TctB family protein [Tistlia consotensis USBA 355]SNR26561.1 Tripartite tricarboxylate transporter TctB family protein [Tistlia consotensis]
MASPSIPGPQSAPSDGGAAPAAAAAQPSTPLRDLLVGLFFLAWAATGWLSVATNEQIFSDLYAGLDPGPALMPLLVLGAVTLGAVAILASGLVRLLRGKAGPGTGGGSPAAEEGGLRRHLVPLGLLATLAVYPTIMEAIGYLAATAFFVLGWILALTGWRGLAGRGERGLALAVALVSTALIVGILYLGFVVVIHAPLP